MEHLTLAETAQWLRVSRWTVYRLGQDGEIDIKPIRGTKRVTRTSVEEYLTRCTVQATDRSSTA